MGDNISLIFYCNLLKLQILNTESQVYSILLHHCTHAVYTDISNHLFRRIFLPTDFTFWHVDSYYRIRDTLNFCLLLEFFVSCRKSIQSQIEFKLSQEWARPIPYSSQGENSDNKFQISSLLIQMGAVLGLFSLILFLFLFLNALDTLDTLFVESLAYVDNSILLSNRYLNECLIWLYIVI